MATLHCLCLPPGRGKPHSMATRLPTGLVSRFSERFYAGTPRWNWTLQRKGLCHCQRRCLHLRILSGQWLRSPRRSQAKCVSQLLQDGMCAHAYMHKGTYMCDIDLDGMRRAAHSQLSFISKSLDWQCLEVGAKLQDLNLDKKCTVFDHNLTNFLRLLNA